MVPAKILSGFVVLALASATLPADASQRAARTPTIKTSTIETPTVMRMSALVTPTDFSASRRHAHRAGHATRVHIYRRRHYSLFEPYAPPVPLFFPFGYRQGYF